MENRLYKNKLPVKDPKVMAHLFGLGLDCDDGHKRLTQADKFSIIGGSEQTHDKMTETLCKTFEDLKNKGKNLQDASMDEISDLIRKIAPPKFFFLLINIMSAPPPPPPRHLHRAVAPKSKTYSSCSTFTRCDPEI